jgi:hypothetical protein
MNTECPQDTLDRLMARLAASAIGVASNGGSFLPLPTLRGLVALAVGTGLLAVVALAVPLMLRIRGRAALVTAALITASAEIVIVLSALSGDPPGRASACGCGGGRMERGWPSDSSRAVAPSRPLDDPRLRARAPGSRNSRRARLCCAGGPVRSGARHRAQQSGLDDLSPLAYRLLAAVRQCTPLSRRDRSSAVVPTQR